jgi:hypothetical protein
MFLFRNIFLLSLAAFLSIFACGLAQNSPKLELPTYTPPAGSPLARKVHPRLFFTAETVPAMRQRLNTIYAAEFQNFIATMDGLIDAALDSIPQNYKFADARNFAFLYLMDPGQMPSFRFGYSRQEYGSSAGAPSRWRCTLPGFEATPTATIPTPCAALLAATSISRSRVFTIGAFPCSHPPTKRKLHKA